MAEMKRLMIELEERKDDIGRLLFSVKEQYNHVYTLLINNSVNDVAKRECLSNMTDDERLVGLTILKIKLDKQNNLQR